MKKYMKICLLSIFPLMLHGAEKLAVNTKASKRISGPRSLAASDSAIKPTATEANGRNDLARSAPVDIVCKKSIELSPPSPDIYFGWGALSERKNSYTPGNDSGR